MLSANLRPYSNNKDSEQLFCTSRSLQEGIQNISSQLSYHPNDVIYLQATLHSFAPAADTRLQIRRYQPSNMLHARTPAHQHKVTHPLAILLPCYNPCDL